MEDGKIQVLIVDDDPFTVEMIAEFVAAWGFDPLEAYTPGQAVQIASQKKVQIALLDFHMPGMDGITLMNSLRTAHPEMFVVLLTGETSVGTSLEAMKKGAFDYITKPIDPLQVFRCLDAVRGKILGLPEPSALDKRPAHPAQ